MTNSVVSGDVNLSHLQVSGSRCVNGRRGVVILDSAINGDLAFFRIGSVRDLYADLAEARAFDNDKLSLPIEALRFSAAIVGDLSVKRCHIQGDCDFSFVKVDGRIDLEDSRFDGDLKFSSTLTQRGPDVEEALLREMRRLPPQDVLFRATCCSLKLRMTKCMNDVDLTGLSVWSTFGVEGEAGVSVDAQYAEVSGDLMTAIGTDDSASLSYMRLEGGINLSHAKLASLTACGLSFVGMGTGHGLILERAKVTTLTIPDCLGGSECEYPEYVTLTDVDIGTWNIGESQRGNRRARRFINLLENDKPFRRSTYRSVEKSQRNNGQDAEADHVYRAMRNREWQEEWAKWKRLKESGQSGRSTPASVAVAFASVSRLLWLSLCWLPHYADRWLLRYGTNPLPLFGIVALSVILMVPAYLHPANFEPSLEFLSASSDRFINKAEAMPYGVRPPQWDWSDAIQIAVHNHLPVVPLSVRTEWEPRSNGPTFWRFFGMTYEVKSVSPEDVFNWVQLFSWICWPLLLTFLVRRLLRERS